MMRILPVAMVLACAASIALAQPKPTAPAPSAAVSAKPGGITRDAYVQRAVDRARHNAERRFDQMDTDHDGVLTDDEIQAWRQAHPRGRGARTQ